MEITRKTDPRLQSGRLIGLPIGRQAGVSGLLLPLRAVLADISFAYAQPHTSHEVNHSWKNLFWRWKVLRTNQIKAAMPHGSRIGANTLRAPMGVSVRPCPPRGRFSRA